MTTNSNLTTAFTKTRYEISRQDSDACLTLRVGERLPDELALWLGECRQRGTSWVITADNPHALKRDDWANRARRCALDALLDRPGIRTLPTRHCADDDSWPIEHGRLVAGLDPGLALALGRRFGQAALVSVAIGRPARLEWIERL